jgi:hypothetical protein
MEMYGENLFKCNRLSCQYFAQGFQSADDRDKHVGKHIRPFRCRDENCTGFTFGLASEREYAKHMKNTHPTAHDQEENFPTDRDVADSMNNAPINVVQSMVRETQVEPNAVAVESLVQDPEPEPTYMRMIKKQRQTEIQCNHCRKAFKKQYNLKSHLKTHEVSERFSCETCGKDFPRYSDYTRHTKKHTGEAMVICGGVLSNGTSWGCGKWFARPDVLRTHHKSDIGKACIVNLHHLEEQMRGPGEISMEGIQL